MIGLTLIYVGAFLVFGWGIAHLFATKSVARGFGEISADNKNIITMEWIVEGATLIFVGLLAAVVTIIGRHDPVSRMVYLVLFFFLNALSIISLFTGFKVSLPPFKLCPVIFTGSSLLIMTGCLID